MIPESIPGVSVSPRANIYFDGKCVSHSLTRSDGTRLTVGVIFPSTLRFDTAAAERVECVAGACEYRLDEQAPWQACRPGDHFCVPANSAFDIRVSETFHYICHFS